MAFEVNEKNAAALEPLFKPWEEPIRHRIRNPEYGGPAIIKPGRRPSKCPLVRGIRAEVGGGVIMPVSARLPTPFSTTGSILSTKSLMKMATQSRSIITGRREKPLRPSSTSMR